MGFGAATASAASTDPDDQTGATPAPRTKSASDTDRIKELQRRLDERDVLIADLLRRVKLLEREVSSRGPAGVKPAYAEQQASVTASAAPPAPSRKLPFALADPPNLVAQAPSSPPPAAPSGEPGASPSSTSPPSSETPSSQPPSQEKSAPGQFSVSEEAAEHALERALVQSGAALLPTGTMEFVPSISYQFQQFALPGQIALSSTGAVLITNNLIRSTQLQQGNLFRIGLPWDFQAQVGLPFAYKSVSNASRVLTSGLAETSVSASGVGDPTFTLTHQVLQESDVVPGLFVNATYNMNVGQVKNNIPVGTGFNDFNLGMTVVKRQDPVVFTGGFSYQNTLPHYNVRPGDQYTPSAGLLIALSPETSLSFGQQLTFIRPTSLSGKNIPGSEQVEGIFSAGVLSILGRGVVVNFTAGVGETRDAPDLTLQLSFPIRLN